MLYLLYWHSLARRFSVTIPRRKETRKTNLALVDFVIYAVFSHVVRISANRSETNIRCAARPGEPSCHSLFFAHSLEPFRVLGWRCRGRSFLCASRRGDRNFAPPGSPSSARILETVVSCRARAVRFTSVEARVSDLGHDSWLLRISQRSCVCALLQTHFSWIIKILNTLIITTAMIMNIN